MKNFLLIFFFLIFSTPIFAQKFAQYNTGTLYDSFENPAQKIFTADTSKMFAFNFLVPSFNANFYLTGNAQAALKSRIFSSYYNTANLQIGQSKNNHINENSNIYLLMFKLYASINGDQELGFSISNKTEARGLISDETAALFNGPSVFPKSAYSNIFNDNFNYQVYQQISFTYREQVTNQFAIGIKLSALSGVTYGKFDITQSNATLDTANDRATLGLAGKSYSSSNEGKSFAQNLLPNFHNPGASISIGTTFKTQDGFLLQGNIKDLGFIHWNKNSSIYVFNNINNPITINGLSTGRREDSIYNKFHYITNTSAFNKTSDFSSPTNGLAELSVNKTYWLDYDRMFKFSPTLIASKELFYTGFTAALVTPITYGKYTITLTSAYTDLNLFNFGGQFMIKKDDFEFYIGSDRLYQSASLLANALRKEQPPLQVSTPATSFTGADFFIGFSWKFGPVVEHRMGMSSIPVNQEKGFIGRLWDRIFPQDAIRNN